jgi:uracil-DNA glycosylase
VTPAAEAGPGRDCSLCPRLVKFRGLQREAHPDWHNAPVPSFGSDGASLLIVGLAPGLKGANRTGRPFTGDYAGDLLYETLRKYGFAQGDYAASADDGLTLIGCRISNTVRCVPPENKPLPAEIAACRPFLTGEIGGMKDLKAILALGRIAHDAVLAALAQKKSAFLFRHGAIHTMASGLVLADSYHCSRYNTNTGKLSTAMFEAVFQELRHLIAR